MRRLRFSDPRLIALLGHTAFILLFFLSVVLPPPTGPFVWPCFLALIGLLDLPVYGLMSPIEHWLLPGVGKDLRVFVLFLLVLGGLQWVFFAHIFVIIQRRRRPPDPNMCRRCEYDLTGNVSGVCPECGEPTPRGTSDTRIKERRAGG